MSGDFLNKDRKDIKEKSYHLLETIQSASL